MPETKLITISQIKKSVRDYTQKEFIELITDIAQACPQAREFMTVKFMSSESADAVLQKYKNKVEYEFFPQKGLGRLNLREAKKAISDFKRICNDRAKGIDIMLFYVENCVMFTDNYGDIDENFYNSAISAYNSVVKDINSGDVELYRIFAERLQLAAENACEGWGFQDDMMDLYYQIDWLDDNDD